MTHTQIFTKEELEALEVLVEHHIEILFERDGKHTTESILYTNIANKLSNYIEEIGYETEWSSEGAELTTTIRPA